MDKYHHHIDLHGFLHNNYNDFLLSYTIRSFAVSLISLFIPVFLLKQGVELFPVVLFELIMFIVTFSFHVPSIIFIKKFGLKASIIASYFVSIGFYFYLHQMTSIVASLGLWTYLLILSLLNSLFASLFWMSFHLMFVKSTEKSKSQGKKLGLLQAIPTIISIFSPLVGGYLITFVGFNITFLVSAGLFVLAIIPLFFSPDTKIEGKFNLRKILHGKSKNMNIVYFCEGTTFAGTSFLWPILLFLFNIAISTMGLLYFISKIFYAGFSYFTGSKSDKGSTKKLFQVGSAAFGFSLVTRSFSKVFALILSSSALPFVAFFQSIGGISAPLFSIPIHSAFYKSTKNRSLIDIVVNREFYLTLGRVSMLVLLVGLLFVLPVEYAFITVLVISGFGSFTILKYTDAFL